MANFAVIGAGPMGLAAAYQLLQLGHQVTIYEADKIVGGMSASFKFDGIKIERYYHFICKSDQPLFDLLDELGIQQSLRWRPTRMGYFFAGKLHNWGDPWALLRFPGLSLISKIRYGLMAFTSTKRTAWQKLDKLDAVSWLRKWVGEEAYNILWKPLFDLKFYQFTPNLSAAWIWSRLKRVGTSRKNLLQEELGYLEGGSDTFLDAISARISELGGKILLSTPVTRIVLGDNSVNGVETKNGPESFDGVICTVPTPYVAALVPELSPEIRAQYDSVNNIAVVCVLVRLAKPVTPYFWLNISDPAMDIPGLIEYSNLNPLGTNIVYAPYYLPGDHPLYQQADAVFTEKVSAYLLRINPQLQAQDILAIAAGRYRYAQPICEPGFLAKLPRINPGVPGLYIADTSYYYPEDRSISESVKLGRHLGRMAAGDQDK